MKIDLVMNYENRLGQALTSNKTAISLVTDSLIPDLNSVAAFVTKHKSKAEDYAATRKVIHEMLGKCFDIEVQGKWGDRYMDFFHQESLNKIYAIEKNPIYKEALRVNSMPEMVVGSFRAKSLGIDIWEDIEGLLQKNFNPKINDAKQSNYRVMVMLTDDAKACNSEYAHSLNRNIPVVKSLIRRLFADLFEDPAKDLKAYKYLRDLTERIGDLALEITTQANYTGRCLNGLLNPSASVYTKQEREPKSWEIEQKT